MKPKDSRAPRFSSLIFAGVLASASQSNAITYYWDQNGTTSGFGSATGTWTGPTVSRWSTSNDGTGTPGASITTTTLDALNFGTDSVALGTGTITVTGTVNAASLRFGSATTGNVTLSGGTINLAAAATIHVGAGGSTVHTISSTITGAATSLTKTGNTLVLSANNSYTGQTIISAGTIILNNVTALGGSNLGVNGTSSISMGANTTLQSNYAPADLGISDSYVYAPITLTAAGTNNFLIGNGSSSSPAESVRFNLNGAIGGSAGANVVFGNTTGTRNNADSIIVLGAASTYNGTTTIQAGNTANRINVQAGVENALPTTTVLGFDSVAGSGSGRTTQFDLNGNNQTLAGLDNGGTVASLRNIRVTNTGALATLTIDGSGSSTFGGANGSQNAQITGAIALTKSGAGTFTLAAGAGNAFTGATKILGGVLVLGQSNSIQNSAFDTAGSLAGDANNGLRAGVGGIGVTTLTLGGLTGNKNFANVFTTNGGYGNLTALTLNPGTGVTNIYSADIGDGAGGLNLTKTGAGTQELAGATSHTGFTAVSAGTLSLTGSLTGGGAISTSGTGIFSQSATGVIVGVSSFTQGSAGTSVLAGTSSYTGTTSVNAGVLTLDYGIQNNSKLSDSAALILGGGTLNLVGGTHAESVLSTTLTAGTASFVTSSGAAPLQLNSITVGDGASVDFGAGGIATTDNLNTAYGVLGGWATVNGSLAVNSTNTADGLITAAISSDVTRLNSGPQVISDGPSNNVRIIEGTGTAADITLGSATTTVGTIFQSNSGGTSAATINSGTQTLRTNAIIMASGVGALTIGNGTLSAANAGGDLELAPTPSGSALTVNSVIADNTSASTLTKTGLGSVTLTNANTYDGATIVNGGALFITNNNALGSTVGATTINGGNGTGANSLSLTSATSDLTIAENINLFGNAAGRAQLSNSSAQNHTLTGAIDVSSDTNLSQLNSNSTGSITVSGDITGTMANGALFFLRGTSTSDLNRVIGSVNLTGGSFAKTDAGTWLVGAAGETYSWASTTVAVGTLKMGAAGVLPSASGLIMGNTTGGSTGTLDLNGYSQTTSGITYSGLGVSTGTRTITNSDGVNAATITINNATDNVSGSTAANSIVLTGNLALTKQGAGKLTLIGANSYTGGTTVSAGTLQATIDAASSINALSTGAVSIAAGSTLVLDNVKTTNVADAISNTFTGDGLLKLQFAAGTTVRNATMPNVTGFNGTIQLSNFGATGDKWSAATLGTVAGSLVVDSGSTIFVSAGPAAFTGGITLNGAGNAEGRGALRISGATTVLGGNISLASSSTISMENVASEITGNISSSAAGANTLTLGATGSVGGILSGNISDGTGTIALTQTAGAYTLSGNLSHTGGVNVSGGLLTLSGANNTYTGVTAIAATNGRSLLVTANNALGATGSGNETTIGANGQLGFSGGINYSATERIIGSGAGNANAHGVFTVGSRGFIQSVSGNNTFAGNIELSADGTSRIGTQDGASLTLSGAITQGAGITTANILFRVGNLAGDFVTLSNAGNSFGGDTTVFTGLAGPDYAGVRLGVSNALPTNLSISGFGGTGAGAALDLNGKNQSLNGLIAGSGTGQLKIINLDTVTASNLTLNPTADQTTTNTTIIGGGGLGVINVIKDGSFAQTLGGISTYTGTTAVSAGTLFVTGALSGSAVTVQSAGAIGGSGALGNGLNIAAGGNLDLTGAALAAKSTGILSLTGGSLTLGSLHFLDLVGWDWANADPGTYELIDGTFTVDFGSTAFTSVETAYDFGNGKGGYFTTGSLNAVVFAIPEPGTALLGMIGALALLRRRR